MEEKEKGGSTPKKAEEDEAQKILREIVTEIDEAVWKSRETIHALWKMGRKDKVEALKDAQEAIEKALSLYIRVFNEGDQRR